jgi:phenylacetyl-CoA:acceptor oxidoreductase subunit 2
VLFACGLAAATGRPAFVGPAAILALLFAACQGRMVHAARGIPAWRAREVPWLLVATGLAEGAGLWLVLAAFLGEHSPRVVLWLGLAIVARWVLFRLYRRGLGTRLAVGAARALDSAGRLLLGVGTMVPLALLIVAVAADPLPWARWIALVAGLCATIAGVWLKGTIVLRAGHTQGYALPALPVRGVRA